MHWKHVHKIADLAVAVAVWPYPGFRWAAVVVALTLAEQLLLVVHPSGFWHNGGLDANSRTGLVVLAWLGWTVAAWTCYWMFAATTAFLRHPERRAVPRMLASAVPLLMVLIANVYVMSWLLFWRLGEFPNLDSLYFGALNADMLMRYILQAEPTSLALPIAAVAVTTSVMFVVTGRMCRRLGPETEPWPTYAGRGGLVLLLAANAAWLGVDYARFTADPEARPRNWIEAGRDPWPPFFFELRFHANPGLTLLSAWALEDDPTAAGDLPTTLLEPRAAEETSDVPAVVDATVRPNIVLITVESLRSDVILQTHQQREIVPQINDLARTGCFFPNCYSQSTHSDYADPAIMSSLYPLRSVSQHFYHRSDPWPKKCIYDILKPRGYATAMFSSQNEAWGRMDQFYESDNLDTFFDSRSYDGPTYVESSYFRRWMEATQLAGKLDDAVTVQAAIDWIETERASGRPFFLSLNLQTSHFPYRLPDGVTGPFQPSAPDRRVSFLGYDRENAAAMRNAYYNALNYLDRQLARLVGHLESTGLGDNTILALTGDHGEAFYESDAGSHAGVPLETTTRVGLIIHGPNRVAAGRDPYLAQIIDIVPTLLGLAGAGPHPAFQGMDLFDPQRPSLERRVVFIHCNNPRVATDAVVSGSGWKYMFDRRRESAILQFQPTDLETHANLLSAEPEVAGVLAQLLTEWERRQLLYYQRPRYYHWFYAPPAPSPSSRQCLLLRRAAVRRQAIERPSAAARPTAVPVKQQPEPRAITRRSSPG